MTDIKNRKAFNVTGPCRPGEHYMVDTGAKIETIVHDYIEKGQYFVINRPRQYGKTTTLFHLQDRLQGNYIVINLSFEGRDTYFTSFETLVKALRFDFIDIFKTLSPELEALWKEPIGEMLPDQYLRQKISTLCTVSGKPVVLMIDEVDRASDFGVFNAFLGLLRDMYIRRSAAIPTFQSVILAGVHDIKNLKKKIRPDSEHSYNSPWNIAANFDVDMSFSTAEIQSMLEDYERDHATGMNIEAVAGQLSFYTNGYPFLVSRLCKMIDELSLEWSPAGVDEAETQLLKEQNTLFDDLQKNVENNPSLSALLRDILLNGMEVGFNIRNAEIALGAMYGIIAGRNNKVCVSNIVFETILYDMYSFDRAIRKATERYTQDSSRFIKDGKLDLDKVIDRFAAFMKAEYRDEDSSFIEQQGRLLFLSFLRPIINGTGHYAVEPETRGNRRMDIVVFFGREEKIVELKIWHGEKYEEEGINQLTGYLKSRGQKQGWLVSFADLAKTPGEPGSPPGGRVFEQNGVTIKETIIAYRDKE